MLFTEPMKKIELLVLKSDVDSVMRYLGFAGCLQLIAEATSTGASAEEREIAELRLKVESVARFLGVGDEAAPRAAAARRPTAGVLARQAVRAAGEAKPLIEEETLLLQRRLGLKQAAEELSAFSRRECRPSGPREASPISPSASAPCHRRGFPKLVRPWQRGRSCFR